MEFILLNIHKIKKNLQKFEIKYNESLRIKKILEKILKKIMQRNGISLDYLNLINEGNFEGDINWIDSFKEMSYYNNFFSDIKNNKINFNQGKIYRNNSILNLI